MEYNINNYDKICRACGNLLQIHDRRDEQRMFTLFDTHFQGTFLVDILRLLCPTLQIIITDDLPKNICKKCVCKLIEFNTFQLECLEVNRNLKLTVEKEQIISMENTVSNQTSSQTTKRIEKHLPSTISITENAKNNTTTTTTTDVIIIEDDEDDVDQQYDSRVDLNENNAMDTNDRDDDDGGDGVNDSDIEKCMAGLDDKLKEGFLKGFFICPICNIVFDKFCKLETHLKSHIKPTKNINEKKYVCDICKREFGCLSILKQHLNSETCLQQIPNSLMQIPFKPTAIKARFECKICLKPISNVVDLKVHYQTHEESKTKKCSTCDRTFQTFTSLISHMKLHRGLHVCEYCKKGYDDEDSLKAHYDQHISLIKNNSCICPICGKVYSNSKHAASHLMTHSSYKPVECPICPYRFYHKSHLKRHMMSHTNVRPFSCDECTSKFKTKSALQLHQRRFHNATRPFICPICGIGCASAIDLHKHKIRGHINDGQDNDKKRDVNHKQNDKASNHIDDEQDMNKNWVHDELENDTNYVCICNSMFKLESELLSHISTNNCHSTQNVDN